MPETSEKKTEELKARLKDAEAGTGGLKRLSISDFKRITTEGIRQVFTEPTVLTHDGEDVCVIMTVEDYFAFQPPTNNPLKKPLMKIFEDRLFREVV